MYRRTTREASLSSLPPSLATALEVHARTHQLSLEGVRVWLTHSENPPAEGFFGKMMGRRANPVDADAAHDGVVVLHPTHVIVGTHGEVRGASMLSLPLLQASVTTELAQLAALGGPQPQDGVFLTGFPGEHGRPGSHFVGLGSEPAAQDCIRELRAAIERAKNPR